MATNQIVSIVIIDSDGEARHKTENALGNLSNVYVPGSAPDFQSGFRLVQQLKPHLVILSLDPDLEGAIAAIERIGQSFPWISVFVSSSSKQSDVILRAIRAGANEFLLRPINPNELTAAIQKVARAQLAKAAEATASAGKVISVFCAKGGYGTTTVAVNTATNLAAHSDRPVVIVDLDLEAGDVATFLGVSPKYTITNVTSNLAKVDQVYLQSVLTRHESGVYILAEPERLEEAETITPAQIRELLTQFRSIAGFTFVDLKKTFDDSALTVLDLSDMILLVMVLSVPAIRSTQRTLEVFQRLGYPREKVKLVVNRYLANAEIKVADVEKTLEYPVSYLIPNDFPTAMTAINRGRPISETAPNSELGAIFKRMALDIGGLDSGEAGKSGRSGLFGKLFNK